MVYTHVKARFFWVSEIRWDSILAPVKSAESSKKKIRSEQKRAFIIQYCKRCNFVL